MNQYQDRQQDGSPAATTGEAICNDCGNPPGLIRHRVQVAEQGGESGYAVCLWPCGHEVGMDGSCPACPTPASSSNPEVSA